MSYEGWIGVDLDGTLAEYDGWKGIEHVGKPVKVMCDRVRHWLSDGIRVKIFTARVTETPDRKLEDIERPINEFCLSEFGQTLEITNIKDFGMIQLWDDRAVQVEENTGKIMYLQT